MTQQEQRIALAEWTKDGGFPVPKETDYLRDLNAVRALETLKADPECTPDVCGFEMLHATAAQRCEALCRVLWPERWTK